MSNQQIELDEKEIVNSNEKTKSYYHKKHTAYSKYYYGRNAFKISDSNRVIYSLTNHEEFEQLMLPFGYTKEKVQAFATVQQAAHDAIYNQTTFASGKIGAYSIYEKAFAAAQLEFRFAVKIAKVALRDELKKVEQLRLFAKRGRSIDDTFAYMESFYSQTLADSKILSRLTVYGYPLERLKACQELFLAAKTAHQLYATACAESNEATRFQKQQLAELDRWMSEYYALAKIAEAQKWQK